MKKFLSGWKIWTILSALIFFMTCGVFVLWAWGLDRIIDLITGSRNFNNYNVENLEENKLTADSRNKLMSDLQEWSVPEWAIMAFHLTKCPDWWSVYKPADGKFLKWDSSILGNKDNLWIVWWVYWNKITLTEAQLPSHNHDIRLGKRDWTDNGGDRHPVTLINPATWLDPEWGTLAHSHTSQTQSVWNWAQINIENENVHVLYCIKNSKPKEEGPINGDTINVKYLCEWPAPDGYNMTVWQSWSDSKATRTHGGTGPCSYKCNDKYEPKREGMSVSCVNDYVWECVATYCERYQQYGPGGNGGRGQVVCQEELCGNSNYRCKYDAMCKKPNSSVPAIDDELCLGKKPHCKLEADPTTPVDPI